MRLPALAFLAALLLPAAPVSADTLARAASLGVAPAALPPEQARSGPGVLVRGVAPGSNAARLGVAPGDVILSVNGRAVAAPGELPLAVRGLKEGAALRLSVRRGEAVLELAGPAAGNAREEYAGAEVTYGTVPFRGGLLRDILVMPAGRRDAPVVYLIQGYDCASMESPDPEHHHRRLAAGLLRRGIGLYRVEKPGSGDSRNEPGCADIDFDTELAAFEAGYRALVEGHRVDAGRAFLFGHSMGGLQAPMLAARPLPTPRGVAVYGTALRPWYDYMLGALRFQRLIHQNGDPVESAVQTEAAREPLRRFFVERQIPARIAAADPAHGAVLRDFYDWDGAERLAGRHYAYWHQVAHAPLTEAWRDTRTPVLVLHGAADVQAVDDEDHRRIADIVNHYRPGTACFVQFAGTDHGWNLSGGPGAPRPQGRPPVNPRVAEVLADWVTARMAGPPAGPDACAGVTLTAAERR
ncbi:MAG TPA: alpha/beta fold hydrolase [Azospirillaceae bacterium]|nr:alpha/beta fold hydrolase [Azospirillaceae bacterium]